MEILYDVFDFQDRLGRAPHRLFVAGREFAFDVAVENDQTCRRLLQAVIVNAPKRVDIAYTNGD